MGAVEGSHIWQELQVLLSLNLPDSAWYLWQATATCWYLDRERLIIAAPTEQSARQLAQTYLPVVRHTLKAIANAPQRVSVVAFA